MNSWLIVILTLVFSALFSGLEIAFISANKLKIELDKNKGLLSAKILAGFIKDPSSIIGVLLLGNNVALVIFGIEMAKILEPGIINLLGPDIARESLVLLIQTIISTILILISAEFIPKALFRLNPNGLLNIFAPGIKLFYLFFYPVVFLLVSMSEFILKRVFRLELAVDKYTFSAVDLDNYVKEFSSDNSIENEVNQEILMFQNAIDFRNVKLRECMVPRTEITAIEENDTIDELTKAFIDSGKSKILIFKDTIDNIIGFVHSSDIFKTPKTVKSIIRSIPIVPETMLANIVLSNFIKEHKTVAVVVDEFGGTSGIVTMEDIIEEIFGEIRDEYDVETQLEKKINDNEFIFSARLEIDYLNEKYHLELPESDEYETLGGLIINIHESIPQKGDIIIDGQFKYHINTASESRIDLVNLIILKE
jgi:CBS domain containing-hemolysin-like protein